MLESGTAFENETLTVGFVTLPNPKSLVGSIRPLTLISLRVKNLMVRVSFPKLGLLKKLYKNTLTCISKFSLGL